MATLFDKCNTGDSSQSKFYGALWRGETFTPSTDYTITSIKALIYKLGSPGTITADIRTTSGGAPTSTVLCSGTTDGNTLPTSSPFEWREISFGAGAALTSGVQYALTLNLGGDTNNAVNWRWTTPSGYAGGQWVTSSDSGSTWSLSLSNYDLMFECWGTSSAAGNSDFFMLF